MNFNDFYAICIDMIKKPVQQRPLHPQQQPGFSPPSVYCHAGCRPFKDDTPVRR